MTKGVFHLCPPFVPQILKPAEPLNFTDFPPKFLLSNNIKVRPFFSEWSHRVLTREICRQFHTAKVVKSLEKSIFMDFDEPFLSWIWNHFYKSCCIGNPSSGTDPRIGHSDQLPAIYANSSVEFRKIFPKTSFVVISPSISPRL